MRAPPPLPPSLPPSLLPPSPPPPDHTSASATATTIATACTTHAAFSTARTTSALASAWQDIFLRELISNAADACDKKRFLSLTEEGGTFYEGRVRLVADKEANTLTIEDNGIGMTRADLKNNLGKIAQSGALS